MIDNPSPPGPVVITYEWSVQPPDFNPDIWPTWITDELEARQKLRYQARPGSILVKRVKWTAVGQWEEVK